jgi:hypothetical protein
MESEGAVRREEGRRVCVTVSPRCALKVAVLSVCHRCFWEFVHYTMQSTAMFFTFCALDKHPTRLWRVQVRLEKVKML